MLRTTSIDAIAIDHMADSENITVDEVINSKVDGAKVGTNATKSKSQNKSKGKNLTKSKALTQSFESGFFTFRAEQAFTKLKQAIIEVLILHYFDMNGYIWIETDVSGYTIGRLLSQLTLNNSS